MTTLRRLEVPDDLSEAEGSIWRDVVDSKPADWFQPDSAPLLKEYCRAVVMCDLLAGKVAEALAEGKEPTQVLMKMRDMESKRMLMLGTKMRLTQQSRYTPMASATANKKAGAARPWQQQAA